MGLLTIFVQLLLQVSLANQVIELVIEKSETRKPRLLDQVAEYETSLSSKATYGHKVENHDNYAYSTTLYVGSNRQQLNLLLDTGSSIMWLQSEQCSP